MINDIWHFLTTSKNWTGNEDTQIFILRDLGDHVRYSLIALIIAAAIALPLGLLIGHTGKGSLAVVSFVNSTRALPAFGLLIYLYILVSPHIHGKGDLVYLIPTEIVLVLLAIPPILSNTYAGVDAVDPAVRDAARGMGMTGGQVLFRVELPNAFPLIMSGIRSATLQVIATATIGAYIALGGLGRLIYDGQSQGPFQSTPEGHAATGQLLGGAVMVAALALFSDLVLAMIQRFVTSRGITGRYRTDTSALSGAARMAELHQPQPADI